MATWFDWTFTDLEDDRTTVRVEFMKGPGPESPDPRELTRKINMAPRAAVLRVKLFPEGHAKAGDPYKVTLEVAEGITPTFVRRFGWDRWLTAADAYARTKGQVTEPLAKAIGAAQGRRPGRRGHDGSFLPAIAARYVELRSQGSRAPVKAIADEHQVSRNTAAGWIKQARDKGLLPKARRAGKAG